MSRYHIAVCDDEKIARQIVRTAIAGIFEKEGAEADIETFSNALDLEERMNYCTFDLLLLDIEMEPLSGQEFADRLRSRNMNVDIIFVSSYMDKVFDTFYVQPFAFVRKTCFIEDITRAVGKWLASVRHSVPNAPGYESILMKKKNGVGKYNAGKIIFVEAKKNRQLIKLSDKQERDEVIESLSSLEEKLAPLGFMRIQKSFIVNFRHVGEIKTGRVIMSDGSDVPISRGRTRDVMAAYMNWLHDHSAITSGAE